MDRKKPGFAQLNLIAGDVERSVSFYRRLGIVLSEPARNAAGAAFHAGGETENHVGFDVDSAAFARVWNYGWAARSDLIGRVVIGFSVASREAVDRLYNELTEAGHPALASPHDAFWGARYAIVEDPSGIAVGLMSPIDNALKTQPPIDLPN